MYIQSLGFHSGRIASTCTLKQQIYSRGRVLWKRLPAYSQATTFNLFMGGSLDLMSLSCLKQSTYPVCKLPESIWLFLLTPWVQNGAACTNGWIKLQVFKLQAFSVNIWRPWISSPCIAWRQNVWKSADAPGLRWNLSAARSGDFFALRIVGRGTELVKVLYPLNLQKYTLQQVASMDPCNHVE